MVKRYGAASTEKPPENWSRFVRTNLCFGGDVSTETHTSMSLASCGLYRIRSYYAVLPTPRAIRFSVCAPVVGSTTFSEWVRSCDACLLRSAWRCLLF
ncbi:hypothetical protein J6590_037877 [Homalodisca vitripennis]|nr:hypothetical protein J6590_037877 [Homalodisca vitripennis]